MKPIFIYLDQMHWIALARAYHGRDNKHRSLLRTIQTAIQKERVAFPLSIFHSIETVKDPNGPRRTRLAQVMMELSRGWVIAPPWQVVPQELELALEGASGKQPQVLKKHLSLKTVEALFNIHGESYDADAWKQYKGAKHDYARRIEKARIQQDGKTYQREQLRILYVRNLVISLTSDLERISTKHNKNPEDVVFTLGLFENVPSIDVQLELITARDRNIGKDVDPNDFEDISFLSVAIPYCDIVVTENSWSDYAVRKQLQLDVKYSTVILSNLLALEHYLS